VKLEYDPEIDILMKNKKRQAAKTINLGEDVWADINEKAKNRNQRKNPQPNTTH